MIREAEIQRRLEEMIRDGTLYGRIARKEALNRADAGHSSGTFIPDFNLDYLVRRLSVRSAASVLASLEQVDLISTGRHNISSGRGERLYPDLVLASKKTGHIVIVEVKRDDQTTREALTELLAYEQEVRNQLPYLSGDQIMFVLVSSSFPTLLSHAVGQTILWQRKQLLALEIVPDRGSLAFQIVLPVGWSSTRLNHVPSRCFQTADLIVTPNRPEDGKPLDALVLDMTHVMAREGERLGSHGFVLVSHDHGAMLPGQHPDVYTIGVVSTSSMLEEMISRGDESQRITRLMEYAVKHMSDTAAAPERVLSRVAQPAIEILSKHGTCQLKYLGDLEARLSGTLAMSSIIHRYSPYAMLYWGLPHTYREVLVQHQALTEMFPFLKRLPNPQDARTGLFVLAYLTSRLEFQDGHFGYQELWRFGKSIGACQRILQACAAAEQPPAAALDASLSWLGHEVMSGLCEIAFRVRGVQGLENPPPLMWGGPERAAEMRHNLTEWITWFRGCFLARHDGHRRAFDSGMALHALFDEHLGSMMSRDERRVLSAQAVEAAVEAYGFAVAALADDAAGEAPKGRIRDILQRTNLPIVAGQQNVRTIAGPSEWIRALPRLFGVYDEMLPSVLHELMPVDLSGVDWEWIRREVQNASASRKNAVGITIGSGGQVEVSDFTEVDGPLPVVEDHSGEVLLAIEHSGSIVVIRKCKWDDVISGAAF
jgi:hypothetical protein